MNDTLLNQYIQIAGSIINCEFFKRHITLCVSAGYGYC
jgi:hypothetical protein